MPPTPTTRLVLIRHGEAQAAIEGIVAGPTGCTGLSERGRRQAAALAERLQRTEELQGVDAVLTSVLARAVETAAILAPALGGLNGIRDCDLCELHPGECDGLRWEEFQTRYGSRAQTDPDWPISPGGESLNQFDNRVRMALYGILGRYTGRSVVVVGHGGFIVASALALLGLGGLRPRPTFRLDPTHTSITEWESVDLVSTWRLVRYNDSAHLAGLPGE